MNRMTAVRASRSGRRHRRLARAAVVAGAALGIFGHGAARAETWQADVVVSYQHGDYGSEEKTTVVSVPVTLKRLFAWGDASVMVPYVSLDSGGDVVLVDGTPQSNGGDDGSASGLGDVVLKGRYSAVEQKGRLPFVDLVGRVKLPTAKDDLGTGEFDVGFGSELAYRFGGKYFALADVMYTFIGDPPDTDYRNRIAWDVGFAWQPERRWTLSAYYDYASSLLSKPAAKSLMFYAGYRLRPDVRLYTLLDAGLSETASDVGLSAGVKYSF